MGMIIFLIAGAALFVGGLNFAVNAAERKNQNKT